MRNLNRALPFCALPLAPFGRALTDVDSETALGGWVVWAPCRATSKLRDCGGDNVGGERMGEERKRGNSRVALFASVLAIAGVASFSLERAPANPDAMTGEGLLDVCTRAEADWIGFCNGYIQAAIDLMEQLAKSVSASRVLSETI